MKRAYALVRTKLGRANYVAEALREIPGVVSVDLVSGPFDLVALVEGPEASLVARTLLTRVATVDGIIGFTSCLVVTRKQEDCACLAPAGKVGVGMRG